MDWERLISDYFDDALSPEEVFALFQWIRAHPDNARRFAGAAFLHRRLQHRLSAMQLLQEAPGTATTSSRELSLANATSALGSPPVSVIRILRRDFWRVGSIAAAILLIVGVLSFIVWPKSSPARLVDADNVRWGAGMTPPKPGDRLPKRELVLDAGLIKLRFDNGNQMIIQGPARFAIVGARSVALGQGALTAVVTKAGRGLQISTATARVTDLGTEFGVEASAGGTRIMVFTGKVRVSASAGAAMEELSAGSAVEVSAAGISAVAFQPTAFTRVMPVDLRPLDIVDLLSGGDGRGSLSGVGIDAATGRTGQIRAVTVRKGSHQYVRVDDVPAVDGCFIPGGRMPVDSEGHLFTFPKTNLFSYGLIWAGPDVPWQGELPIVTSLPGEAGPPTSCVLVMHSNNGFTLNLQAIRELHPHIAITGFRARVGNSYRAAELESNPAKPRASIHVIVDGIARFEKFSFANTEPPFDVACSLSDQDHYLTLATTDGGDGNACDWVLWTHPELLVHQRARESMDELERHQD